MAGREFLDQVAVVTGASSGIGRETALALARAGARVALASRNVGRLHEAAEEIRSLGRQALVVPTDVTQREQVQRLVDRVLAEWGRIDILVANAGAYVRAPIWELTVADVERSLAVNFYGALYAVLIALPHMRRRESGHIVLVSSLDGHFGLPLDAPYVSAKFALRGFGEVLRQELHGSGIYVTTVCPGRVDTPLLEGLHVPAISAKIRPERVARAIVRALRRRQPEVIVPAHARALVYAYTLSRRLGDWLVRRFRLQGWYTDSEER